VCLLARWGRIELSRDPRGECALAVLSADSTALWRRSQASVGQRSPLPWRHLLGLHGVRMVWTARRAERRARRVSGWAALPAVHGRQSAASASAALVVRRGAARLLAPTGRWRPAEPARSLDLGEQIGSAIALSPAGAHGEPLGLEFGRIASWRAWRPCDGPLRSLGADRSLELPGPVFDELPVISSGSPRGSLRGGSMGVICDPGDGVLLAGSAARSRRSPGARLPLRRRGRRRGGSLVSVQAQITRR